MELRGPPRGPAIDDDEAGRLLNALLDAGINLIDTSIDYGRSEELIGQLPVPPARRVLPGLQCGCPLELPPDAQPPFTHDFSPANIRAGIEQSLRRLRTDHLDLVQVHMSPAASSSKPTGPSTRWAAARRGQGPLPRHVRHDAAPRRPHRDGRLRRVPDSLLGGPARARGADHRAAAAGPARWSRRSGTGGPVGGEGLAPVRPSGSPRARRAPLGGRRDRRPARRHEPPRVHPALHPQPPRASSTIVGTRRLLPPRREPAVAAKGPLPADLYEEAKRRLPAG